MTETLLQKLQREAREEIYNFPGKYWIDTVNVSIAHGKLCDSIESLTKKAYLAGLEAAKEISSELGHQQDDDTIWLNMDEFHKEIEKITESV